MLEAAVQYADRGWWVFPIKPRGKTPITEHGVKDASCDEAVIREWWGKWPQANIGLACGPSGLVVVDIDAEGLEAWKTLYRQYHEVIPETATSVTGGGGFHLIYSTYLEIHNSASKLAKGVDIRGAGGYIILPPSIHPSGNAYRWQKANQPVAPFPSLLAYMLDKEEKPRKATKPVIADGSPDAITRWLATAQPGRRNASLYWAACRLAENGKSGMEIEKMLTPTALGIGLGEREIRKTIQSAVGSRHD
jgi:hypothetical protein